MNAYQERQVRKAKRNIFIIKIVVMVFALFLLLNIAHLTCFPGPIQAAKRLQAKNDVIDIGTALSAYKTEYGQLPVWTNSTVSGELLAALSGSNARQIVFLDAVPAKRGKSGITNETYVDPWGAPYLVALDLDGDGKVRAGTNHIEVQKPVAVWNDPALSKIAAKPDQLRRRYVTSWE